jgi:hypothetical protein
MLRAGIAALAAACALWAGPAAAAQMQAWMQGDFDDDPNWSYWEVTIRYDSDLGVISDIPEGKAFTWDAGMGSPPAVMSIEGFVTSQQAGTPDYHFSFTDFTSFRIERGSYFDNFQAAGPGFDLYLGDNVFGVGTGHPGFTDLRFDTSWTRSQDEYGDWHIGIQTMLPHAHGEMTVTALTAAPEPATWAMMIAGFGMAGSVLRWRRRVEATAA